MSQPTPNRRDLLLGAAAASVALPNPARAASHMSSCPAWERALTAYRNADLALEREVDTYARYEAALYDARPARPQWSEAWVESGKTFRDGRMAFLAADREWHELDKQAREETGYDAADKALTAVTKAHERAFRELIATPAPTVAAAYEKLRAYREEEPEIEVVEDIIADLQRLASATT